MKLKFIKTDILRYTEIFKIFGYMIYTKHNNNNNFIQFI